jgi:hypothetical protein
VVWGDPAAIRARVQEHLDAGADHVALWALDETGDPFGLETLRALAPELPAITRGAAAR